MKVNYCLIGITLLFSGIYMSLIKKDKPVFTKFYDLLNEEQKMKYEKFDLDAWWKPHETITRDLSKFYCEYFEICLGKPLDFKIDNIESIDKMKKVLSSVK